MNFSSILGMLSAGSVGVVAGGVFGLPFQNKATKQENNQQQEIVPQIRKEEEKPVLTFNNSLSKDQADILKRLWNGNDSSNKHLIDYFDYQAWVEKAKQYSVVKEKWPGDIIFIKDKSDEHLGEELRNKCYSAAQWFFIGSRSDNNIDVKEFMKNVDGGFSPETTKDLCATDTGTLPTEIKSVTKKTLLSASGYTCNDGATSQVEWIEEMHNLKKFSTMCQSIQSTVVLEIEYTDGVKKYQLLKSRKSPNGNDFEAIPGDGKIYSSISEIPGVLDLFKTEK